MWLQDVSGIRDLVSVVRNKHPIQRWLGVCKEGVRAGLEKRKLGRVSEEAPSFALQQQQSWVTCSNPADRNPESTMHLIAVTVVLLVTQKGTEIY